MKLTTGEIKIKYGSYGNTIEEIELLLLPKAKLNLTLEQETNTVKMTVADTDFYNNNLAGSLDYATVDSLIRQLIKMRNQLSEESTTE